MLRQYVTRSLNVKTIKDVSQNRFLNLTGLFLCLIIS